MGVSHFLKSDVHFGRDDHGRDVKFFGETSGVYMLWDQSLDKLQMVGAAFETNAAVTLGSTLSVGDNMSIAASKQIACLGAGATGLIMKNLKNSATSALSGDILDVELYIGEYSYYFAVYRAKA